MRRWNPAAIETKGFALMFDQIYFLLGKCLLRKPFYCFNCVVCLLIIWLTDVPKIHCILDNNQIGLNISIKGHSA